MAQLSGEKEQSSKNELTIEFPFDEDLEQKLSDHSHFDRILISGKRESRISVKAAKIFHSFPSVHFLQIWCGITRAAVRHAMYCPSLTELLIFELKKGGGRLARFSEIHNLEYFSCMYGLNGSDLMEISKLPSLRQLGAQHAEITEEALRSLMSAPMLTKIDFECSNFNDKFAEIISQSGRITSLEIGATSITSKGIEAICSMKQLKELDIWATNIGESDLDSLIDLKNLEYLSIGGHDDQTVFTAGGTFPKLERIRSLKQVWLDGLRVSREEWDYLNSRYERVRVTSIHDD